MNESRATCPLCQGKARPEFRRVENFRYFHCAPWQGTQWNRIEHRLFAFITQNWRGKPLLTHQVIVQLIASTTTDKGLTVQCRLDKNTYDKGIKISAAEMATINITPADFHGEWNYTIKPRKLNN